MGEFKSTWSSVELNLLLCAFILVKSGCFTDRETLQLATRMGFEPTRAKVCHSLDNYVVQKELSQTFDKHCSDRPRGGGLPYIFSTKLRPEGRKKNFWDPSPSLGLDDRSFLSESLDPDLDGIPLDWSDPFLQETWTFAKELPIISRIPWPASLFRFRSFNYWGTKRRSHI